MLKILLAEDDTNIRRLIAKNLINNGYSVAECVDGKTALNAYNREHYDMVITDIMMPNVDGNKLADTIRKDNKDIPILMLTALDTFTDKEKGFKSGADDYMVKPVDMPEMILRTKALLRRYKIVSENKIEFKSIALYNNSNTAFLNGQNVELTKKEFQLLFRLLSSPNVIFTRNQLIDEIWGYDSESDDRTIDTHIKRIREKIVCDDFDIVTVRGLGYKATVK